MESPLSSGVFGPWTAHASRGISRQALPAFFPGRIDGQVSAGTPCCFAPPQCRSISRAKHRSYGNSRQRWKLAELLFHKRLGLRIFSRLRWEISPCFDKRRRAKKALTINRQRLPGFLFLFRRNFRFFS
jgi:hypothetical protein